METGLSLFKSRVAKRIFFLFLVCAMLPITVFSYLSFSQVSTQLQDQSMRRIQNNTKSYGLILFERFVFLDLELDMFGSTALISAKEKKILRTGLPFNNPIEKRKGHLNAVAFVTETGSILNLSGKMDGLPENLRKMSEDSIASRTRIYFEPGIDKGVRVFLAKKAFDSHGNPGILIGEADTFQLWGIGYDNILPPLTESSILDHNRNVLFSSFQIPTQILHRIRFENESLESRSLEYSSDGEGFFIGYWPMFLKSKFDGPNLIVVLRNMQEDVFAPLAHFKVLFPLVALLAFWVVLLLSIISIRKSMVPLEKLKEGARRLANRDFDTRVEVNSGDEFESLADTFNKSTTRLGRHFHAMEAMAEIDRAVHSSLNTNTIVTTAMKHMHSFFSCETISFGIINSRKSDSMRMFSCSTKECDTIQEKYLTISHDDNLFLSKQSDSFVLSINNQTLSFLPDEIIQTVKHFMIIPLFHNKILSGLICLGHKENYSYSDDDLAHGKRLANQLSSALSNALLVEELESLNWGTLGALARTVDTKSKWTAGHSERVAELAVKIAKVMGFDAKAIDNLNRAALLHDIGKIGIPMRILDKPDQLTDEEYLHIKEHPIIGAKIIEPIEAYADVIPIILQHHEKYNGKGYPSGLSGENIIIGARILAVADVYDAIISSRPYRQGWVKEKVIQLIKDESGQHFDPIIVDAFLSVDQIGSFL